MKRLIRASRSKEVTLNRVEHDRDSEVYKGEGERIYYDYFDSQDNYLVSICYFPKSNGLFVDETRLWEELNSDTNVMPFTHRRSNGEESIHHVNKGSLRTYYDSIDKFERQLRKLYKANCIDIKEDDSYEGDSYESDGDSYLNQLEAEGYECTDQSTQGGGRVGTYTYEHLETGDVIVVDAGDYNWD